MHTKIHKPIVLLLPPRRMAHLDVARHAGLFAQWAKRHLTPKNVLLAGGAVVFLLAAGCTAAFFLPRTVALSYANSNCFTNPVFLPNLISHKQSQTYSATPVASVSVAGYPLYSRTTCVAPTKAPKERTTEVIHFGAAIFSKDIRVSSGAFPSLASQNPLTTPISTQGQLTLELDSVDHTFTYQLAANEKSVLCITHGTALMCDITKLNLAQSAKYDATLKRHFGHASAGVVFTHSLTTVEMVQVTASSIGADQTLYDAPSDFTLSLNRAAVSIEGAHLYLVTGDTRQEVAVTTSLADKTITVHVTQPLARNASFVFTVDHIVAADSGFLPTPFSLPFKTSGGPKVLAVNIGNYKVGLGSSVVITFDSPVSTTQALQNFVRLEASGSAVAATTSAQSNIVIIKPTAALPRCATLTISVLDGLQNNFGISGGSAWQFKSRTLCQAVFSIGTSVQGRGITAYSFGSGPSKVIFVGTTHGDEKSSTYLLNRWIDYLEANAGSIPANRTIIVIPNLNPDGFAMGRRTNANNVDLNRNFPASDWKSGVTMPDGSFNPNGGGSAPLSEPESSALANYVLAQGPRLVLTYHATAGVVIANDAGDSNALAHAYDQKSNVGFASGGGDLFDYDTTGAFEDWLYDGPGITALLIELWTFSGNEFSGNQNAMWAMAQLP